MKLIDKVNDDIKKAMLAKEKDKLEAIRAIKAALLLANTSGGSEVNEADEIKILQKLVKQRKDAAEIYSNQNRTDLAEVELFQANIYETYLPAMMNDSEVEVEIKKVIAEIGASSIKDLGKVMGVASKNLAGKADNKKVSEIAKKLLS